jgi:hypothetical protein
MSFAVEATDGSGWAPNGLRFRTARAAESYALDLMMRWTGCHDTRVAESEDEPTNSPTVEWWEGRDK